MNTYRTWSMIAAVSLWLQSCTYTPTSIFQYSHYEIANKLQTEMAVNNNDSCDISYQIYYYRDDVYYPEIIFDDAVLSKEDYVRSTEKIFSDLGCVVRRVHKAEEANFKIVIEHPPIRRLYQRDLAEASLGLIPTWGTRERVSTYGFNSINLKKEHAYIINEKFYYHLILIPFPGKFSGISSYEAALSNFLEHS